MSNLCKSRLYSVIVGQLVTEKSNAIQKDNAYAFAVNPTADKNDIREAVESVFKVNVLKVTTLNVHGKVKNTRGHAGRRQDWKKAYVTLVPGQSIDLSSFGTAKAEKE